MAMDQLPVSTEGVWTRPADPKPKALEAADKVKAGWDRIASFGFTFPVNRSGTKTDDASAALQAFYKGVQELSGLSAAEPQLEWMTREDFGKFLQFCAGMLERRPVYRQRIRAAVEKVKLLRPEFEDLAVEFLELQQPSQAAVVVPQARAPPGAPPDGRRLQASHAATAAEVMHESTGKQITTTSPSLSKNFGSKKTSSCVFTSRRAPSTAVVVWIDFSKQVLGTSSLNTSPGVQLVGFHDDDKAEDYAPPQVWLGSVQTLMETEGFHVAAVVVNRRHEQFVRSVLELYDGRGARPPLVVVVTSPGSEAVDLGSWGVADGGGEGVTAWREADRIVLSSLGSPTLHA